MAAPLVCLVVLCATFPVAITGTSDGNHELPSALVPNFDSIFEDTGSEMTARLSALESEMEYNDKITKDILQRLAAVEARLAEEDKPLVEKKRASAVQEDSDKELVPSGAAAEQPGEKESRRPPQAAQTTTKEESSQRGAVREVTIIPPTKRTTERKGIAGLQRPAKKRASCGTPPPREGTTVKVTRGTAVYKCKPHHRNIGGQRTRSVCGVISGLWSPVTIFCTNFTKCTMVIGGRSVYNGTVSTTKSGYTCQRWDKQEPNRHWFMTDQSFMTTTGVGPETRSGASNYCRDPGVMVSDKKLWCYTTQPGVRSEPCHVPKCQVPK